MKTLSELMAKAAHDAWAAWQRYADQIVDQTTYIDELGTVEISEQKWQDWNRKSFLEFAELTQKEQVSDFEIAKKILIPAFEEWLIEQRDSESGTDWKSVINTLRARLNNQHPLPVVNKVEDAP